jgi:hypothetical protein
LLELVHEVEFRQELFQVGGAAIGSTNGAASLLNRQFVGQYLSPGGDGGTERRIAGRVERIICDNFLDYKNGVAQSQAINLQSHNHTILTHNVESLSAFVQCWRACQKE